MGVPPIVRLGGIWALEGERCLTSAAASRGLRWCDWWLCGTPVCGTGWCGTPEDGMWCVGGSAGGEIAWNPCSDLGTISISSSCCAAPLAFFLKNQRRLFILFRSKKFILRLEKMFILHLFSIVGKKWSKLVKWWVKNSGVGIRLKTYR